MKKDRRSRIFSGKPAASKTHLICRSDGKKKLRPIAALGKVLLPRPGLAGTGNLTLAGGRLDDDTTRTTC